MRTTKNFRVLHAIENAKASPRKSPRPVLIESFSQAVSKFQVPSVAVKQPDSSLKRTENSTSPLRYYPQRSPNIANLAKINIFCAPYFQDEMSTTNRSEINKGNQTHNKSQSESDISPIASFRSRLGLPEKIHESVNVSPVFSFRRLHNSQTPTSHLKAFEKQIKRSSVLSQSTSRERFMTKKRDTMLSTASNESADSSASKKLMNLPLHLIPSPANKKLVRPVIIPRVTKVDKILDEVRQNSGLHNINKKTLELSSTKDNSPLKTESNATELSPYGFASKRIVTEGDHHHHSSSSDPLKFNDITKKLTDYRILFKTEMHDLEKVRNPFNQKREVVSRQHRMSITKRKTIPPQQKQKIKTKLAKKILSVLKKMSLLNLTMDEIIQHKVFPSIPYEHEGSKDLFDYVKSGDILKVAKTLKQNKYFVYDFDHARETALHWAAKRNYPAIVKHLLEKGADPNAADLTGRTPLFLAAKGEFKICIKLLLFHGADPTLRSQNNKLPTDYAKDPETHDLLEKAYLIHKKLSPMKIKDYKKNWDLLDKTAFRVKMLAVK